MPIPLTLALFLHVPLTAAALAEARALQAGPFDPERSFAGDIRPSSHDQMILTAAASARDDYVPDYSLAVAYVCRPQAKAMSCTVTARLLQVKPKEQDSIAAGLGLARASVRGGRSKALGAALAAGSLDWLETDLDRCEGAVAALDEVRRADWGPDLLHIFQREEDQEILLHPAELRLRMTGSYTTSQWTGWRNAAGVPVAIDSLLTRLEPCWAPSQAKPPWLRN
jgi:hypothetical protein